MDEYINRKAFKRKLIDEKSFFPAIVARALEEMPAADVVSTKAFEQVKWERDTAIEQLESYGVGFCENKELAEVKHGEWIYKHRHRGGFVKRTGYDEFGNLHTITVDDRFEIHDPYCSVCGKLGGEFLNYCGNCGAKMDGGKNE